MEIYTRSGAGFIRIAVLALTLAKMNLVWTLTLNLALLSDRAGMAALGVIVALAGARAGIDLPLVMVAASGALTAPVLRRAIKPAPCRPPQISDIKRLSILVAATVAFVVSLAWPWPLQWVVAAVAQSALVMVSYATAGSRAGLHLWWLVVSLLMLFVTGVSPGSFPWVIGVAWAELSLLVGVSLLIPDPAQWSRVALQPSAPPLEEVSE